MFAVDVFTSGVESSINASGRLFWGKHKMVTNADVLVVVYQKAKFETVVIDFHKNIDHLPAWVRPTPEPQSLVHHQPSHQMHVLDDLFGYNLLHVLEPDGHVLWQFLLRLKKRNLALYQRKFQVFGMSLLYGVSIVRYICSSIDVAICTKWNHADQLAPNEFLR